MSERDARWISTRSGCPAGARVFCANGNTCPFGATATRGVLWIVSLFVAGCAFPHERDIQLVLSERQHLDNLRDPATLTAATRPAPVDQGRWAGSLATTRPTTREATGPVLSLTIEQAVLMALDRNRDLVVQRYNPQISQLAEQGLYGQFDPTVAASASASRTWPTTGQSGSKSIQAQAAIQQFFATGTTVSAGLTAIDSGSQLYGDQRDATTSVRAGISVTQSLLQGAGLRVNLASIRQAELDVLQSQYQLRGFTEQLASDTEQTYIDYVLAERVLEIAESALVVSQQQLDETDAMIRSGKSATSDRAAALATVAQRKEDLINARSALEQTRLKFLRLVNAGTASAAGNWDARLELIQPAMPTGALESVDAHVRVALLYRSDLNQARLQAERGDLDVIKTGNGLLPRLDLFATLGRTWYFHSPAPNGFTNGAAYDASVGVNFDYPLLNRAARAAYLSSRASRDQAVEAVANLAQLVELDVRLAYEETVRAQEQISATTATLAARDEALRVEQERYRVGKSTSLLVSLAQQDVLNSRIAQATAVAAYLKGLVDVYRLEGSLLERRGIVTMDYPPK
jgi:outer membrane protein